jgi:hypothetical protein
MSDSPRSSILNTLGWGAYLACSWTWCIGMFLPVLMIRDFGWWSFAVFAIPNCVGAATFGWVMRRPGTSEAVVAAHGRAIKAFSLVTVAFQMFFLFAMIPRGEGHTRDAFFGWFFGLILGVFARSDFRKTNIASLLAFAGSVALLVGFLFDHPSPFQLPSRPSDLPGLAFLAPVCVFGFALSPYLDGTFHRAARAPRRGVPARFGIGFLFMFPIMIGFTLLYAPSLINDAPAGQLGAMTLSLLAIPAVLHIGSQIGFTIGVHQGVIASPQEVQSTSWQRELTWLGCVVVAGIVSWFITRNSETMELTYRLFMSFYGLIFPAYVWICMIPTFPNPTKPTTRQMVVFATAVALAGPFYYLGFIELKYWALAPGVMIPLLARLVIGRPAVVNAANER